MEFRSQWGSAALVVVIALGACVGSFAGTEPTHDTAEPSQDVTATPEDAVTSTSTDAPAGDVPPASPGDAGTPLAAAPLSPAELLQKAEAIVEEYTADKRIWVRGFKSGLRVIGASVGMRDEGGPQDTLAETHMTLPEWLNQANLLGVVPQGSRMNFRLLWKVEPTPNTPADPHEFSMKLVNHDGYTERSQENERSRVNLSEHPFGTVFWTEHAFEPLTNSAPGLYDVYVSGTALPVESIPLGQILVTGWAEDQESVRAKVASLFPDATRILGGHAVLTKWFEYRFPVSGLVGPPRSLVIVSSVDWMEDEEDLTDVATVTVRYASGKNEEHSIKLGRDTASTWYNLHARGVVKHQLAPVAWSSRVRRDTVDFDANVYVARFDLAPGGDLPASVAVRYAADKGILRLRGIALSP